MVRLCRRSLVACLSLIAVLFACAVARAETVVRPLITQPVNDAQRITLHGNTRPEAHNPEFDRGAVPDSFPMEHLWLQLKRSPEQEQALVQLIDAMHTPGSPYYHQWLTAKEYGATFGLAQSDIDQISAWLEGQGFKVDAVFTNRMMIEFSGNAGNVREAFQTEIHTLDVNGEKHFANTSDPQIPAALAPAVEGVVSMTDFKPRGDHKSLTHNFHDPATGDLVERAASEGASADYTSGSGSSTTYSLVPADAWAIYNLAPIYAAGYAGENQTIALLQDSDDYSDADFTAFRAKFGLSAAYPKGNLVTVHPAGSAACSDPGVNTDDDEVELDMEMATAIAPNATIELASCQGTSNWGGLQAMQNLINGSVHPPVVSMSYGACEAVSGATQNAAFSTTFQQAAAEGVSVFASSGDNAAAGCEEALDTQGQKYASYGDNVTGWGESAYNVSVGGTDFQDGALKAYSKYWSASNAGNFGSAKSYIPEIPWDSSCASSVEWQYAGAASALAYCNSTAGEKILDATGGGSGLSSCYSGAASTKGDGSSGTCQGLAKPSWQSGVFGIPNDGKRDVPDVSLFAANGIWGHYWTICFSDPGNGGQSCSGAPSTWHGIGGTSASTPVMAAIQLLIDQKFGAQGNPNYVYYALASVEYGASGDANCNSNRTGGPSSSCVFYDITTGDNDVNCLGTINCFLPQGQTNGLLSASDSADEETYAATTGYDLTTGIGSVNAGNLFAKWGSASSGGKIGTTLTLSVSENPAPQGSLETLLVNLAWPSGGAPSGNLDYSLDGGVLTGMNCPLTPSPLMCSATIPTASLATGSHSLVVIYAGGANNYPSNASGTFTVTASTAIPPATSFVASVVYDPGVPPTALMQASDGNFYSSTSTTDGSAILVKLAAGTFAPTVLHTFDLAKEGLGNNGVVEGPNGLLYGVTSYNSNGGGGTFFSVSSSGTFTAIHTFTQAQLYVVEAQPTLGSDGNFYVVSGRGGVNGQGSLVQISPSGAYNILWSFAGGEQPQGGMVETASGTFYGAAYGGGANSSGYIYKMVVSGGSATVTDVADLAYATSGGGPGATLIVGPNGDLYGMAAGGGTAGLGDGGTIFEVTPSGTLTVLYDFSTNETQIGSFPQMGYLLAGDGNFYGDEIEQPGAMGNYQSAIWAMTPTGSFSIPNNSNGSISGALVDSFYPMLQASDGTILQSSSEGGGTGGEPGNGDVVKLTFKPALKGPVQVTVTGTPISGSPFTLNYVVTNGFSLTYQLCYGYVQGGAAGAGTFSGKLTNGSAQIIPTAAGTYTYAVTCGGIESGYAKVTVASGSKLGTTTTLSANPNPVSSGASVTLTATVSAASGTPGGSVTFALGTLALGTVPLSNGVAVLSASSSGYSQGTYPLTASYAGSTNYAASASTPTNIIIQAAAKSTTTTTIAVSPTSVPSGGNATFTATVTSPGIRPTGNVTFSSGGVSHGPYALTAKGANSATASYPISTAGLAPAEYGVKAIYNGDANNLTSTSGNVNLTVTAVAMVTITAAPNPVTIGQNITITIKVAPKGYTGPAPTGSVKLYLDGVNYGTIPLTNGTGKVTQSTAGYPAGSYTLTATYPGDATYPAAKTASGYTVMLQ